jgi:hypothetical protein
MLFMSLCGGNITVDSGVVDSGVVGVASKSKKFGTIVCR